MQAVVKKVVYSFRYRLGPGQVGRKVFHIVLSNIAARAKRILPSAKIAYSPPFQYNILLVSLYELKTTKNNDFFSNKCAIVLRKYV